MSSRLSRRVPARRGLRPWDTRGCSRVQERVNGRGLGSLFVAAPGQVAATLWHRVELSGAGHSFLLCAEGLDWAFQRRPVWGGSLGWARPDECLEIEVLGVAQGEALFGGKRGRREKQASQLRIMQPSKIEHKGQKRISWSCGSVDGDFFPMEFGCPSGTFWFSPG